MKPQIPDYLKALAEIQAQCRAANGASPEYHYESMEAFVLAHGKQMKPEPLPFASLFPRGVMKQCFMNAANLVLGERLNAPVKKLIYCEGYALSVIPTMHAWCLAEFDGRWVVVDTTWETPGPEYFGIAFKTDFLRKSLLAQKHYGLIDSYKAKWPLLRIPPGKAGQFKHAVMDLI